MRLLLVQDQELLGKDLHHELVKNGYIVDNVSDGDTGLEQAATGVHDVIILDSSQDGPNGLSILKELRGQEDDIPIFLLTPNHGSHFNVQWLGVRRIS